MAIVFSPSAIVPILMIGLILLIAYRVFIKKQRPKNYYTPFDYITDQSDREFQEDINQEDDGST